MLTHIILQNFKRFETVSIELGDSVVFIGPNNIGKTSALQALALWDAGVRAWLARYPDGSVSASKKRYGATLNRKDLIAMPTPSAKLLWKNQRIRQGAGKNKTSNVLIQITVKGINDGIEWECGMEFDYGNSESVYCRPIRHGENILTIPEQAKLHSIAYLPPMSGLAANEFVKQAGEISVLIGEGQTAQVIRNLCYTTYSREDKKQWDSVVGIIDNLFGVTLFPPKLEAARSEITLAYRESGIKEDKLDISCAGRGLQQALLLFVYLFSHPGSVLLLDEPDAHLEILRQREIFSCLVKTAREQGSQIIAASHSEVILDEAIEHGKVVAFIGVPHVLNEGKGSQLRKSLSTVGWNQYYQAEQMGWVLYLEGSTDLKILQAFAEKLNHSARKALERPFVHFLGHNQPQGAREHFYALREAFSELRGFALFDRLEKQIEQNKPLTEYMWKKREIENYLSQRETLLAFSVADYDSYNIFSKKSTYQQRQETMENCIQEIETARQTLGEPAPWSSDTKASDDFLDRLFANYSKKIGAGLVLRKSEYHQLVPFVPMNMIDAEIITVLDSIFDIYQSVQKARTDASGF